MKDNGRQLKSMEYAAFDPGSGYWLQSGRAAGSWSCSTFFLTSCNFSIISATNRA